jgi:tripartite-type tricarboxylate transporter receptor subunit TctC
MFDNLGVSEQYVKSGKLKALAVGSAKRVASLPEVPTVAEAGLPGFVAVTWFGMVAPPKTPPEIAARLSNAIAEALKQPEVQHRLAELSADAVGDTPAEMAAFMKEDGERWRRVINNAHVKPD